MNFVIYFSTMINWV